MRPLRRCPAVWGLKLSFSAALAGRRLRTLPHCATNNISSAESDTICAYFLDRFLHITSEMSDPFSIVAGIVGIAAAGVQLANTVYRISDTMRSAPQEMRLIAGNLMHLSSVLEELNDVLEKGKEQRIYKPRVLTNTRSILDRFEYVQQEVEKIIDKRNSVRDRLRWLFKSTKVTGLLVELEAQKSALNLILWTVQLAVEKKKPQADLERTKRFRNLVEVLMRENRQKIITIEENHHQHKITIPRSKALPSIPEEPGRTPPPDYDSTMAQEAHATGINTSQTSQMACSATWLYEMAFEPDSDKDKVKSDKENDTTRRKRRSSPARDEPYPRASTSQQPSTALVKYVPLDHLRRIQVPTAISNLLNKWTFLSNETIQAVKAEIIGKEVLDEPLVIDDYGDEQEDRTNERKHSPRPYARSGSRRPSEPSDRIDMTVEQDEWDWDPDPIYVENTYDYLPDGTSHHYRRTSSDLPSLLTGSTRLKPGPRQSSQHRPSNSSRDLRYGEIPYQPPPPPPPPASGTETRYEYSSPQNGYHSRRSTVYPNRSEQSGPYHSYENQDPLPIEWRRESERSRHTATHNMPYYQRKESFFPEQDLAEERLRHLTELQKREKRERRMKEEVERKEKEFKMEAEIAVLRREREEWQKGKALEEARVKAENAIRVENMKKELEELRTYRLAQEEEEKRKQEMAEREADIQSAKEEAKKQRDRIIEEHEQMILKKEAEAKLIQEKLTRSHKEQVKELEAREEAKMAAVQRAMERIDENSEHKKSRTFQSPQRDGYYTLSETQDLTLHMPADGSATSTRNKPRDERSSPPSSDGNSTTESLDSDHQEPEQKVLLSTPYDMRRPHTKSLIASLSSNNIDPLFELTSSRERTTRAPQPRPLAPPESTAGAAAAAANHLQGSLLWEPFSRAGVSDLYASLCASGWAPVYMRGNDQGQTWYHGPRPIHARFLRPEYVPQIEFADVADPLAAGAYLVVGCEWIEEDALRLHGFEHQLFEAGYYVLEAEVGYEDLLSLVAMSFLLRETCLRRTAMKAVSGRTKGREVGDSSRRSSMLSVPDLGVLTGAPRLLGIREDGDDVSVETVSTEA